MPLFQKYGDMYEMDPIALAAQGYQESQLNHSLVSHRGAVGVMQVLPSTARDKNVAIRQIDKLENNIHAGAKYMAFIKNRYFSSPEITPTDQMLLSLAAYNAGPGNARKMRALAVKMGLDPNQWFGHVEIAAGRLIGRETVQYVANIYKYYLAYSSSKGLYTNRQLLLRQVIER
jgi:membrane-bound lytic murein transglycosylase MltF